VNNWIKSTFGASLVGLIYIVATQGKDFASGALALWMLLLNAAKTAPLGLASFGIALVLSVLSRYFLRKHLPQLRCPLSRDFLIDAAAVVVGIAAVWFQMSHLAPIDRVNALWIGLVAGLAAPHVYNLLAALGGLVVRSIRITPEGAP